ncbi:MAG: TIGR02147 family protein [Chitinispirillaceae bacterium]|nr:TIGR02147 family protein [Chitinispirillaceae bacterium]
MNPNQSIVEYTDYRKFLRDYYLDRKKNIRNFSYKLIADGAGLSSASFVRMVIEGEKNLTRESAAGFARALRLKKKEAEYFEYIVFFSQAKDLRTKELYLKKIDGFRKRNKPDLLLPREYDYLRNWLHAVVREAVEIPSFNGKPEKIAAGFFFRVNPDDVQKSIDFLLASGFLTKDKQGKLAKVAKTISTVNIPRNDELVLIAKKYHLRMLEMAGKALLELPREQRSVTNTTLSLSENSYEAALKRIETMRYELLELAASDSAADRVCQLNVNLFPLVKKVS